ncbi:ankyrin [Zopfia rhizophila CBS 207.26]|uniref:Ankyrin n=1 Tax=Zopfia rhizophila CBS 207.26 TaxID=1314779 RepID=A0A6A6DN44_9PEZI|nr:ankyrin [Zopfia rhizophila CBS 207.26]
MLLLKSMYLTIGENPLDGAVIEHHLPIVRYLIEEARASITERSLARAGLDDQLEIINLFMERHGMTAKREGPMILKKAAQNGQMDAVRLLIEKYKVDINSCLPHRETRLEILPKDRVRAPLHRNGSNLLHGDSRPAPWTAGEFGKIATVKLLFELGANPPESLLYATFQHVVPHLEIASLLLEKRLDVECIDEKGMTPLMLVAHSRGNKWLTSVKFLIDVGKANAHDEDLLIEECADILSEPNLLSVATKTRNLEMVNLLTEKSAGIHSELGLLRHLSHVGNLEMVKHLTKLGAEIDTLACPVPPTALGSHGLSKRLQEIESICRLLKC